MTLIGKPCLCGHDVLDHYPEGCIRCRDVYRREPVNPWQHRFRVAR